MGKSIVSKKKFGFRYPIIRDFDDFKKVVFANLLPVILICNTLLLIILFFKPEPILNLFIGLINVIWLILLFDLKEWLAKRWYLTLEKKRKAREGNSSHV